jgi:hypothetical protein
VLSCRFEPGSEPDVTNTASGNPGAVHSGTSILPREWHLTNVTIQATAPPVRVGEIE